MEALIFDVDGTMADTERDGHRVAFNLAFDEAGLGWDWTVDLYGQLLAVTGGKERIRFFVEEFLSTPQQIEPDLATFAAELHAKKTAYYLSLLRRKEIPLRAGVRRLLLEARAAGLRLAIATTTTEANVSELLTANLGEESLSWFEVIAAGDIVENKKPAPDVFQYCVTALGLKVEECLAFEDSENGLKSAVAAGLITIVTENAYTQGQDFAHAAILLDGMGTADTSAVVLAGDDLEGGYLTIADIKRIHQQHLV